MSIPITVIGRLAEDPDVVQAGQKKITKMRVLVNTGEYRDGKFVQDDEPTGYNVEADFELGEEAAAALGKGDRIIVVGRERTHAYHVDGATRRNRILEADHIGADLRSQHVTVTRDLTPSN